MTEPEKKKRRTKAQILAEKAEFEKVAAEAAAKLAALAKHKKTRVVKPKPIPAVETTVVEAPIEPAPSEPCNEVCICNKPFPLTLTLWQKIHKWLGGKV